jgi:hypothetical protein
VYFDDPTYIVAAVPTVIALAVSTRLGAIVRELPVIVRGKVSNERHAAVAGRGRPQEATSAVGYKTLFGSEQNSDPGQDFAKLYISQTMISWRFARPATFSTLAWVLLRRDSLGKGPN